MEQGAWDKAIVHAIETHGPQSVDELAALLGISKSNMHACVMKLLEEGKILPVATVPRDAKKRGPSSWRYGTSKMAQTFAQRLADLEAKIGLLERAYLYGIGAPPRA